jgi:hypothetical protein
MHVIVLHAVLCQLIANIVTGSLVMQTYITASNTTSGIFRDVINEAHYDPLQCTKKSIKVPVHDLKDPCKFDAVKAQEERALVRSEKKAKMASCILIWVNQHKCRLC